MVGVLSQCALKVVLKSIPTLCDLSAKVNRQLRVHNNFVDNCGLKLKFNHGRSTYSHMIHTVPLRSVKLVCNSLVAQDCFKQSNFCYYRGWSRRPLSWISLQPDYCPQPTYLCDELRRPADTEASRRLRSASSTSLYVRRTRLSTVGDRAFPVAAARLWNSLPSHVTATPSFSIFCCRLKSHLFPLSYSAFWLFSRLYSARVFFNINANPKPKA